MLGYGQYRLNQAQNALGDKQAVLVEAQQRADDKRAEDNIEVQVMSFVVPHLNNLAKPGPEFDSSRRVVRATAEYLSREKSRTGLALMAASIAEGNDAIPQEEKSRIQEATVTGSSTSKWFAVLDSLSGGDLSLAKIRANQRFAQINDMHLNFKIQIYKTKISNNFAIVAEGPLERNFALERASQARSNGLASDAFAQQDKGWTFVGEAPFK